ncbi:DUF5133 domain-containing protein [Streptomyces sp. NPDC056938]|uniref:DUF5133 domain-containing protein n=1 Tax=unclassified Streptomyces TaxID=2593676 RepID=UPI0036327E5C
MSSPSSAPACSPENPPGRPVGGPCPGHNAGPIAPSRRIRADAPPRDTAEPSRAVQDTPCPGDPEGPAPTRRELDDVTYTLCVSTGTLTIETALTAAQLQLATGLTDPAPTRGTAAGDVQLTT